MNWLLKTSVFIPFILLQLFANGQSVDTNPLTINVFNDHVTLLLQKKKVFEKLLTTDHNGDEAIFIRVDRFNDLTRMEPFINNGLKYYYWNGPTLFFHSINSTVLELVTYSHKAGYYQYTFKADDSLIAFRLTEHPKRNFPILQKLKISKIKSTK